MPHIERIASITNDLGEGPLWDHQSKSLFWVDSLKGKILRLPLVNGLKKIYPGIHDLTNSEEYINVKCKHVLTKGKNKGNHCSNYCLLGNEYCKIHIKDKLVNNNDKNED